MAFLDVLSDLYHLTNKMLDFSKKTLKTQEIFISLKNLTFD